ncbi:anaerobic ribonucleoside triphosphate reductase [Texcoconibacillus texcoconensis]|uniref:Ribonucleoside-triphosphate reductase n=1 Tax=Texcoconibacillus texcoconensis TaxID=1095777 RepID=A0A840QTR4_9BACI|nr:anaerobic ribonucleoside triphosphate reductase [Texcoconibacillus texcoconensis]MBB5174688.1 ribonucleoside-triphosphate reductase [Texcoconibacillus texcoconensis]
MGQARELIKQLEGVIAEEGELLQENANVDGQSPLGKMNKFASEASKWYTDEYLLSTDVREAVQGNVLYIHDKDYYPTGTTTCCQIPLGSLLALGFNTGHGFIREPQTIQSALAQASIILQANQNTQHGGQAYATFDYDLAPYVRKTYVRNVEKMRRFEVAEDKVEEYAWKETERDVFQACEAFIHNANSMHSRGGGQVPFVSINYGTDTSREGRLLMWQMLLATQRGLGNGETPIFPIQIFKVKEGVNANEGDPNYDLFQLAIETTSERLFPNFSFLDATFNKEYETGDPKNEVAYMGCRTRVMGNRHGEETPVGRGNLSFSSLNLVRLALRAEGDEKSFFQLLDGAIEISKKQLLERLDYQGQQKAGQFEFLYRQGVWKYGKALGANDRLKDVLKQGTLSLGFIGLAEALTALYGQHHGECEKTWERGVEIVRYMREKMDQAADDHDVNFTLLATPAEGLSGKFTKMDQDEFGVHQGVTDKTYYTNSFHIPVGFSIKASEKIRREAPFHALCNAGHITYIELDGNAKGNPQAIEQIVRFMKTSEIGYGSINHPVDRCKECGYQGMLDDHCPNCGEDDESRFERIRRITGYLVGDLKRWNGAKKEEEKERVKHQ